MADIVPVLSNAETVKVTNNYFSRAKRVVQPWHDQIRRWRRYYSFDHYDSNQKPGEDRYGDPTYTNVVDLAVGIMLANDVEYRAFGFSPTASEEKDTSHIEKYLVGLWEANDIREGSHQVFDLFMNFCRDGAGVVYTVWDEEIARSSETMMMQPDPQSPTGVAPVRGYTEPPVRVQVIDPLKVFIVPGGPNRWLQVCKVDRLSVYDIELIYGKRLPKYSHMVDSIKMTTFGDLKDYWRLAEAEVPRLDPSQMMPPGEMGSAQEMHMMPDGSMMSNSEMSGPMMDMAGPMATPMMEPGEQQPNAKKYVVQHALIFEDQVIWPMHDTQYPDLPFKIGFFKPISKDDAKNWGHNIMKPLETTITLLEKQINRRTMQINRNTAMPLVVQAMEGREIDVDASVYNVVRLAPSEDIKFPVWPGNPPDVEAQIGFLTRRAQQSGFSDVAFGSGPNQIAGYALTQLGDQNRIRLEQPVKHIQLLLSQWAQSAIAITATFAPDAFIRVYGQMRGKDFNDQIFSPELANYKVKATIKPEFPNEQVRNHAMATQVRGVLSESTIMERYLDIDQPDDERAKRLREMAMNHPALQQYALMSTLMEMAQGGDQAAAMALQMLVSQGSSANQGGRPVEPNAPEQPQGLASPTGQPPPQASGGEPPGQSIEDAMGAIATAAPGMRG